MLVSHSFNANFDVFFPVVLWLWIRLPFATFFTAQERKRREAEEAESRRSPSGKEIGKNTMKTPTVSNRFPLDTFGPSKKKLRCAETLI